LNWDDRLWEDHKGLRDYRDALSKQLGLDPPPEMALAHDKTDFPAVLADKARLFEQLFPLGPRASRDATPGLVCAWGCYDPSTNAIANLEWHQTEQQIGGVGDPHPGGIEATVAHELFHAYQTKQIKSAKDGKPHDRRAAEWDSAWGKGLTPGPLERDAEEFGLDPTTPLGALCSGCTLCR